MVQLLSMNKLLPLQNGSTRGAFTITSNVDVTAGRTYQWKVEKNGTSPQVYLPASEQLNSDIVIVGDTRKVIRIVSNTLSL